MIGGISTNDLSRLAGRANRKRVLQSNRFALRKNPCTRDEEFFNKARLTNNYHLCFTKRAAQKSTSTRKFQRLVLRDIEAPNTTRMRRFVTRIRPSYRSCSRLLSADPDVVIYAAYARRVTRYTRGVRSARFANTRYIVFAL